MLDLGEGRELEAEQREGRERRQLGAARGLAEGQAQRERAEGEQEVAERREGSYCSTRGVWRSIQSA